MNPGPILSKRLQFHTQENRLFTLHSPVPEAGLLLDRFQGDESVSEPFQFTLELLSERADLAPGAFLGQPMGVTLRTASGAGSRVAPAHKAGQISQTAASKPRPATCATRSTGHRSKLRRCQATRLARLACVISLPLGSPVEPDV